MIQTNFRQTAPWLLLAIAAVYPQTAHLQSTSDNPFANVINYVSNLFKTTVGSLRFFYEDINVYIADELNDVSPNDKDVYDFIVVGAGSAGATVASRLSEIKETTVLLIEAGREENSLMDIPLAAMYLQLDKTINWDYKMEASPSYCRGIENHQCRMPRGKGGNHRDYDDWARMGCVGWSWNDVFPFFKKLENFDVHEPQVESEYHSTGGPLNIGQPSYRTKLATTFLQAGVQRGFPIVDYDGKEQIGYSYTHATVKDGQRFSSNRAYLYPAKGRPNLFLTKGSHANKILIDQVTKRAYGVSYTKDNQVIQVMARREVILCAGAINSPQILMLSGVGPERHLESMNIPVLQNAPVGYNLMDHMTYWGLNFVVNDSISIITENIINPMNSALNDYFLKRSGPLTVIGGVEAVSFLDVDDLNARKGQPNMELLFASISLGSDRIAYQTFGITRDVYESYYLNMLNKDTFMILPTLLSPKSKGRIMLRSNNPQDPPRIFPNYFKDPDDMRRMILGIREAIAVTKTRPFQKYDTQLPNNPIPGCEQFPKDTDAYWDCAVRTLADTLYHPVGTCKMGARNDSTAVVDPRLRVIGINGLRVADASIMPKIIVGHSNVPAIMIGEKLAEMVKQDWGLL